MALKKKNKTMEVLSSLCHNKETRRSAEHCNPHADGARLNELGWSQ